VSNIPTLLLGLIVFLGSKLIIRVRYWPHDLSYQFYCITLYFTALSRIRRNPLHYDALPCSPLSRLNTYILLSKLVSVGVTVLYIGATVECVWERQYSVCGSEKECVWE
jgi:hypothetical protein